MVKFMYKLNIFLLYSFLGYIFEIIVDLIMKIKPSSGIMSGPFTPIYGLGVLIMLQIKDLYQRLDLTKFLEIALYFITVIIVLTILEQIGGMLLDKVFNKTLWNYSDYKFHITKYIAVEVSLFWGVASIIIGYLVNPLLDKIIYKIPPFLTIFVLIIFITDAINTFFKNI